MITDEHVHMSPPLGGAGGFARAAEHRLPLQLPLTTHAQPMCWPADHRRRSGAMARANVATTART
ncbi:MAG: hypothetical protein M1118_00290 [Chloroflexi bacterium]|nr:hypothetical protein [Chloroflexota bacterium]